MIPSKGIDPRVWEMAIALADIWQAPMHHDYQIFAEDVAGAIQKAIEAEREDILRIIDRGLYFDGSYIETFDDEINLISQAIRNRSNTTTERNEG